MKEDVLIEFREWDYNCGDGCCYEWGVMVYLNGELLDHPENTPFNPVSNSNLGNDAPNVVRAILEKLGHKVNIVQSCDE